MLKLYMIMTFFVTVSAAQNIQKSQAASTSDSLVDVFPLAIGNQWTYGYYWNRYDEMFSSTDTGTVTIRVIKKTRTSDSTIWSMEEISDLWSRFNSGTFYGPSHSIDTIELVERHQNRHPLYRIGENNVILQSVFPFFSSADSMVYRYACVDTDSIKTVWAPYDFDIGEYTFEFKQGVGLLSTNISDGCLCLYGFSGIHSLRSQTITGIAHQAGEPISREYHLAQNYPNPFNPSTTITFTLPSRAFVSLKVFDLIGREVAAIISEVMQAGNYSRQWNASGLPSGTYFYRLQSGSFVETKKLIVLK